MKFTMLEAARERKKSYENLCVENNQKRSAALKEIEAAKVEEQALINRQIEGENVIDELIKVQAEIKVAEAKHQRLVSEIGEHDPKIDLKGLSFHSVYSQITAYKHDGLFKDMGEELAALKEAEEQFLNATEKALIKFYSIRNEVKETVKEAESLFGQASTGSLPMGFDEFLLRPYGLWWDRYDANNILTPVFKRASENVEGKAYVPPVKGPETKSPKPGPNEFVDPNNPSVTYRKIKQGN
ncbi:hypothetical protein [Mesobacillus zeae]|uniref:hypothetical protein n=1 Tax=Mesobacillus zeae TaxID=1917180 RepID=UPI0030084E41